jgi:hypothetical protein
MVPVEMHYFERLPVVGQNTQEVGSPVPESPGEGFSELGGHALKVKQVYLILAGRFLGHQLDVTDVVPDRFGGKSQRFGGLRNPGVCPPSEVGEERGYRVGVAQRLDFGVGYFRVSGNGEGVLLCWLICRIASGLS